MRGDKLSIKLKEASEAYYTIGKPIMSDKKFDTLLAKLKDANPKHPYLKEVGTTGFRQKVSLPIKMGSLNKIRPSELSGWILDTEKTIGVRELKGGFIVTPKIDGLSLLLHYRDGIFQRAYTRGDGLVGQDVTRHATHLYGVSNPYLSKTSTKRFGLEGDVYVVGEAAIHKALFKKVQRLTAKEGAKEYKHARNFVVGMLNSKEVNAKYLKYISIITYDIHGSNLPESKKEKLNLLSLLGFPTVANPSRCLTKKEGEKASKAFSIYRAYYNKPKRSNETTARKLKQFEEAHKKLLRTSNTIQAHNKICRIIHDKTGVSPLMADSSLDFLSHIDGWFRTLKDYPIITDGLVIELNHTNLKEEQGLESNGLNPKGARAIKPDHAQQLTKKGKVSHVEWNISKRGVYKPVAVLSTPLDFDGVAVSRMTLHNALFVKEKKVRKNSVLDVIRSGDVIPYVRGVTNKLDKKGDLPTRCEHCDTKLKWTDADIYCPNNSCTGTINANVGGFFSLLDIPGLSSGTVDLLIENGYNSIHKCLSVKSKDLIKLEGFAKKKADSISKGLNECLLNVEFSTLAHASGCFTTPTSSLGSRKLAIIEGAFGAKKLLKATPKKLRKRIMALDGFSKTSTDIFIEGLPAFQVFVSQVPKKQIKFKVPLKPSSSHLEGRSFVFTGFRDKTLEQLITSNGGTIANGISTNVHTLFYKEAKGTKYTKANSVNKKTGKVTVANLISKGEALPYLENLLRKAYKD